MANDMNLQFKIGASFAELKAAVSQAKTELKSLVTEVKKAGQEVKIKVGLDIAGLNNDIQHLKTTVRNALQGSATEKIKVKIEADAASIKADIAAIKPQIQSALSTFAPISLTINHAKLAQHLQAAEAQVRAAIARMTTPSALNISLNVDALSTGLIAALNALKVEVTALKQAMSRGGGGGRGAGGNGGGLGGASSDVNGFAAAMRDAKTQLLQLVSAFGVLIGLKAFVNITDEAKGFESKLRLVTSSQQELNQVSADLREIAKNNLQALNPSVDLYSKLASSTKSLEGANSSLNTRLTDITLKLMTIGNSTGPAAEGAILQFGQALSGNFSAAGQELNSIIEQAPALADAIAKVYDTNRAGLKKLGAEGKITTEGVVNGLIRQGEEVDKQFKQINSTISGTAATTWDAIKLLIVEMDKAIGLSDAMIGALVAIRDSLNEIVLVAKLAGIALTVAFAPAIVNLIVVLATKLIGLTVNLVGATLASTALRTSLLSITGVFGVLGSAMAGWAIGDYLRMQFIEVELFGIALAKGITVLFQNIKGGFKEIGLALEFAFTNPLEIVKTVLLKLVLWMASVADKIPVFGNGLANSLFDLAEKIAPSGEAGAVFLDKLKKLRESTKKEIDLTKDIYDELADAAIAADVAKNTKSKPNDKALGTVKTKPKPSTADSFAVSKADLDSQLQLLDALFNAEKMGMREYYAEKTNLIERVHNNELANIDAKIKAEKDADKKSDLLTKRAEAEKAKDTALKLNDIDFNKAVSDAKKESVKIGIELDEASFDASMSKFDAKDRDIEDKYKKKLSEFEKSTLDSLGSTKQAAMLIAKKTEFVDGLINTEKAKNNLDRIADEIKTFTEAQANKVKTFELQREKGKLSNADAKLETDIVNDKTRQRLALYIAELERLAPTSEEARKALEDLRLKMQDIPSKKESEEEMQAFWNGINKNAKETADSSAKSGLSQFFLDIAEGAKSGNEAVKDFARGFAQSMAKVASDALAAWAVMKLVGLVGGAFSGGGAAPRTDAPNLMANANVAHTGGIAGSGLRQRTVDMSMFNAAPRYHAGGIAGLQPGEVPSILMKGEEVLTKKDPRHVANGGGQGSGVRIINNIDPNLMQDYLSSSSGEQVIVNLIERNSGTIKQFLG